MNEAKLMGFDSMSPTKRIRMKEKINLSNESSKYAAAIESKYPMFRVHFQITEDYLDLPDVDKSHTEIFPLNLTFIDIAISIHCTIEESKTKSEDIEYYRQIFITSIKLFDNDLEASLQYLDKVTNEYHESCQDINKNLFSIANIHMETAFPSMVDQLALFYYQSEEKEISGDVYSKLLILNWRIIKDTFFQFELSDDKILQNIILIEYLIQSNSSISLPHDYEFRTKRTMGHNSPLAKIFQKKVYVEVNIDGKDFVLDKFNCFFKHKGVGRGYIYEIHGFRIYCKEFFVQSNFYFKIRDEITRSYLDSMTFRNEFDIYQRQHSYLAHLRIKRQNDLISHSKSETNISSLNFTNENDTFQEERANLFLQKFINPYAESLSYILLYFLGFMPSLNVAKSIVGNKIYLMVDQVPYLDDEFGSEYYLGEEVYIDTQELTGFELNNLCACLHTMIIFNYLFHLGDFHDGDYFICSKNSKFKIQIFDLWMSPDQFQLNDIISFSIIPEYDENNYSNFSLSYYNLYFDECENVEENSAFNVSRLMTTLVGRKRLPFITIKSLKMMFSSALKNLNKIFKTENHKEEFYSQIVKYCDEKIQLVSSFLIEKIYDTSQEMLLTNPFLVDDFIEYISIDDYRKYYPVDDEDAFYFKNRSKRNKIDSHEYLVKLSTKRMEILYKELLKIPKMDMIFHSPISL